MVVQSSPRKSPAEIIAALLKQHLPAHPGDYGEMVWVSMILEHWLRRHAPGWRMG